MVFPIVGGDGKPTGYDIENSLRFNDGDSPRLARAQANGNQDKWTWSGWVKRSTLGAAQCFFATTDGSATSFDAKFDANDDLDVYNYLGGGFGARLITDRKFRDVSAWYHIVIVYDSGNGTEAHRLRIYVNGTEETSFSTTNYPSQNEDSDLNVSGSDIEIGRQANGSQFFDGYMAEIFLLDGQAKAPTDFAETDDNGVWIPKDVKDDLTFGTNGFYMEFKQTGTSANSSGIGADTSGNDNHFTPTNLAAIDVTTDTPTNNFATMNPLVYPYANITYSEGNLKLLTGNSENSFTTNTIAPAKGKWYTEIKVTDVGSDALLGITRLPVPVGPNHYPGQQAYDVAYYSANGQKATGGSFSSYGNSYTTNDIVGIAMDLDNNKVYFSKNGTYQNSGDPTSGATGTGAISIPSLANENFVFIAAGEWNGSDTSTFEVNFGNAPFSISSGNTDGKYGNFEYAPPSGYYALCTKNLAEYG
jgi:hypothetical protein